MLQLSGCAAYLTMTKQLRLVFLLGTLLIVSCTPDFYAEQVIETAKDARDQGYRQEDEKRWQRLEKKLGIDAPNESDATKESLKTAFPLASFPRGSCGDPLPLDESLYPVSFYPVFIPYTEDNLREVKSKFCADAWVKKDKNGEKVISVASFYTQKASEFLLLMKNNFGEAEVGSVVVVRSPR